MNELAVAVADLPRAGKSSQWELDLSGEWDCHGEGPEGKCLRIAAIVPGHVHTDLLRAGAIEDPFWRDQALDCQWVGESTWVYRKKFTLGEDLDLADTVLLCDGLDTFANVRLNGAEIGQAFNMFIPHEWSVGKYLIVGENLIEIEFRSNTEATVGLPLGKYFSCFSDNRVFTRRIQCTFGWDWVHSFVSVGIWRPIRLCSFGGVRINDVAFRTLACSETNAELEVELDISVEPNLACEVETALIDAAGQTVWSEQRSPSNLRKLNFQLDSPELWWPNGAGDQPLYTLTTACRDLDGLVLARKTLSVGIRTIQIEQRPKPKGETFTFVVNGRRIFAQGGNWVPADPFPSVLTRDRYDHLIKLAKDARMNMLRAWGGGIYEREEFWEACNRHGIMIMQDFLLACAEYPEDDPSFLQALRHEFPIAITMLRNNPSLVLWSGDNELGMNASPTGDFWGKLAGETISGPLCRVLDPTRPYIKTSPFTPEEFANWEGVNRVNNWPHAGDCHTGVIYSQEFLSSDMRDYRERFSALDGSFLSESAVFSSPPYHSLRKFMSDADISDPTGKMFEFRTKDNPYGGLPFSHFKALEKIAETLYGSFSDSRDRLRKMEYAGYECVRLSLEALRFKPESSSGILFWMFNDCWPASGWSMVDYYGVPKATYYGFKTGAAPVIGCFEYSFERIIASISSHALEATEVCVSLLGVRDGIVTEVWSKFLKLPAGELTRLSDVTSDREGFDFVVLQTKSGAVMDRAVLYAGLPGEIAFQATVLKVARDGNSVSGVIEIHSSAYARAISLEGDAVFEDNYFDMLPGERRAVRWRSLDKLSRPIISVGAWNAGLVTLR